MLYRLIFVSLVVLTGTLTSTAVAKPGSAVYFSHGQYSATLRQSDRRWLLQPMHGPVVEIRFQSPGCTSRLNVPHGVWFVSRDNRGRPELIAPSAIRLPRGFPPTLPMRVCDGNAFRKPGLSVPSIVYDWIGSHVGSVMIDD